LADLLKVFHRLVTKLTLQTSSGICCFYVKLVPGDKIFVALFFGQSRKDRDFHLCSAVEA